MIDTETVILGSSYASLEGDLWARVQTDEEKYRAGVFFLIGGKECCENDFSDITFDENGLKLALSIEFIKVNDLAVVVGMSKSLIFNLDEKIIIEKLNLFRTDADDAGFYRVGAFTIGSTVIVIYEGGIICLSEHGGLKWHLQKYWDDIFAGVEDGFLVFDFEGEGLDPCSYRICVDDGLKVSQKIDERNVCR